LFATAREEETNELTFAMDSIHKNKGRLLEELKKLGKLKLFLEKQSPEELEKNLSKLGYEFDKKVLDEGMSTAEVEIYKTEEEYLKEDLKKLEEKLLALQEEYNKAKNESSLQKTEKDKVKKDLNK
jgi:ABC-type phosphate transport system auxiliary subunit